MYTLADSISSLLGGRRHYKTTPPGRCFYVSTIQSSISWSWKVHLYTGMPCHASVLLVHTLNPKAFVWFYFQRWYIVRVLFLRQESLLSYLSKCFNWLVQTKQIDVVVFYDKALISASALTNENRPTIIMLNSMWPNGYGVELHLFRTQY